MRDRVECISDRATAGAYIFASFYPLTSWSFSAALHSRRRQPSPQPLAQPKLIVPFATALRPALSVFCSDDKYSEEPPDVPRYGSDLASLPILLAWHAEVVAATREHTAASASLDAATRRRRTAWENYFALLGLVFNDTRSSPAARASHTSPVKCNGKERASTPNAGEAEDENDSTAEDEDEEDVSWELEGHDNEGEGRMDLS